MPGLVRVVMDCPDHVARIAVLCHPCASEAQWKVVQDGRRFLTRDYGETGTCELCDIEVFSCLAEALTAEMSGGLELLD